VIDVRDAVQAAARHVPGAEGLSIIQRSDDHVVIDAGNAIVKCGTRDEFGIEAWACERALSLGVPAPHVIAVDTTGPIPYLALSKVAGVALSDTRLPVELAARGARQAGAMVRQLHEVRVPGFGWIDRDHFRRTAQVRGRSASWMAEISAELDAALEELVSCGALTDTQAAVLGDEMRVALPSLEAIGEGRLLHGDLARMHAFVDPQDGVLTGLVDWGDVQVGDPVWDLAIAACHLASPSEGILRVHAIHQRDLFPDVLEGYDPAPNLAERLTVLGSFYLAYRRAWVARLGPGEEGVPNPSLEELRRTLDSIR
jgi:aminoglycoside phosphotransferase (APT) family kinase protein